VQARRTAVKTPERRRGPRRIFAAAGIGVLLLVFLVARFPWQRLLPPLLEVAHAATGAEVRVDALRVGFGATGPRLVARGVSLRWPGNQPLALDAVALRPAWSLGWLRGRPLWHVEASGPPGAWAGAVAPDRVAGRLDEVDVGALPWALLGSSAPLQGRMSGTVDLTRTDGAWQGSAQLSGAPGSVDLGGLPVAIPYEELVARVDVAPDRVSLPEARLVGPLVTASFTGSASAAGASFASWPIDLQVQIERIDPALGGYLGPLGIPLDRQGQARVHVTGSLAAPFLSGAGAGAR
jgi:type II secretion system protein N